MALKKVKLGDLLELCDERNSDLKYDLSDVRGISIKKVFIDTKADMEGVSLKPYILVKPDSFAYVTVTSRNGEKITMAAWAAGNPYMLFFTGIFYGVLAVDVCISFNVSLKVRRAAVRFKEVVHYEQLKASIAERRRRLKMKANFLFPLKSDRPLKESVEELLEKLRGRKNK